jgi:hemolysin activation/secretion protein
MILVFNKKLILATSVYLIAYRLVFADTADDEYQRQRAREQQLRERQEQAPDVHLQETPSQTAIDRLNQNETPCFSIDEIRLQGEDAEQFQWALSAAFENRQGDSDEQLPLCLGSKGINLIMQRVQDAIIAKGYVTTRVLAQTQDLKTRVLTLTLIPGRIHSIRFADGTSARAHVWNTLPANAGDLLNLRDIEQALENFKRLPTVEADIQITPAEGNNVKPGESDLVIQWRQAFPLRLSVSADDSGSRPTGKYQGNVTTSLDHLLTLNDLFYLSFNHDLSGDNRDPHGTRGYTLHYSVPYQYWLMSFTAAQNHYHQTVAGATRDYLYSGENETGEVKLSRLIYRDAKRKTSLSLRGWYRASQNFINDTEVQVQRRRMAGWDAGVSHKEFIGSASLDLNFNYKQGTRLMNALPAPEELFNEGTARPTILLADIQLNLPFQIADQALRYTGYWRAQWNQTPLVPQDKLAIGSRFTVRGFDGERLLSAERGWIIRNDLGFALADTKQELYLGLDYGEINGPSIEKLVGNQIAGGVVGLRGGYKGLSYDLFMGRPISKPKGYVTADNTMGFSVNYSY